jgi:hypothetical protein
MKLEKIEHIQVDASVIGILSPSNHLVTPPRGNNSSTTILHCFIPPTERIPPAEYANAPPLLNKLPFNTLKCFACDESALGKDDSKEPIERRVDSSICALVVPRVLCERRRLLLCFTCWFRSSKETFGRGGADSSANFLADAIVSGSTASCNAISLVGIFDVHLSPHNSNKSLPRAVDILMDPGFCVDVVTL